MSEPISAQFVSDGQNNTIHSQYGVASTGRCGGGRKRFADF